MAEDAIWPAGSELRLVAALELGLSAGERKKTCHLGEQFWLHVLTDAKADQPQLRRIHHPAARSVMGEGVVATGYDIIEPIWKQ